MANGKTKHNFVGENTTRSTARFTADINTRRVVTVDALEANFSPRGSILVMLKDA